MLLDSEIKAKTENSIRLVFNTGKFLALRTKENNWAPGHLGTIVYEIDLETFPVEDGWETLHSEVHNLYCIFGRPKEIDIDYPGFRSISTAPNDMTTWIRAVWSAYVVVSTYELDTYKCFLQTVKDS